VARRVTFLKILGLDVAGMEEAEMRGVDIAFQACSQLLSRCSKVNVRSCSGTNSASSIGIGGACSRAPI